MQHMLLPTKTTSPPAPATAEVAHTAPPLSTTDPPSVTPSEEPQSAIVPPPERGRNGQQMLIGDSSQPEPVQSVESMNADPYARFESSSKSYIATYDVSGPRWRICQAFPLKQITSRTCREKAIADLAALDNGTHKSQLKKCAPVSSRQSVRGGSGAERVAYAPETRSGEYIGRGNNLNKRKSVETLQTVDCDPITVAQKVLKMHPGSVKKSELRSVLSAVVDTAQQWKHKAHILSSKLASLCRLTAVEAHDEKHDHDAVSEERKSSVIRDLAGKGYPPHMDRKLREHRRIVMQALESTCGDDKLKQYQVSCAVRDLFRQDNCKKNDAKIPAAEKAVMKGLEATFALISERSAGESGRGRHKLNDRIVREVLTTAVMMAVPDGVTVNAMKRALGTKVDWHALKTGLERAQRFKGTACELFKTEETSCGAYPADWDKFVAECWLSSTRESERKSDEKWHRTEKKFYRVRWLEREMSNILDYMRTAGVTKFGPKFHLSSWKMAAMKPWYVRRPGRVTCMCRYHLEFDHFTNQRMHP